MKTTLGIDIGASSIKLAVLSDGETLLYQVRKPHYGSPITVLLAMLKEITAQFSIEAYAVTGQTAGALRDYLSHVPFFEDIPAVTEGAKIVAPQAKSIIAIGGQIAMFITGFQNGGALKFALNEGCASGTGSFFEDQMERLGMKIEDYSSMVEQAKSVPRLSGRCSVFAKTDIIHRQQEGTPIEDILLGLCYAMVKSYKAMIVRSLPVEKPVLLTGGVVHNKGVIRAVKEIFELTDEELLVDESHDCIQAIGAAKGARKIGDCHLAQLIEALQQNIHVDVKEESFIEGLPYLENVRLETPPESSVMDTTPLQEKIIEAYQNTGKQTACIMGIDVGSTSTNVILIDEQGNLVDYQYLRTRGDAQKAVHQGIDSIHERLGEAIKIKRTGVTGSGRYLIGKMLNAETIRDEITAQSKGAVMANPLVDTVFEIGGQDSKYIHIENGQAVDFQMNKICAAGTGSFIEEQAARLNIPIHDYGKLALSSTTPLDLGERCTVFVETAIHTALSKGAHKKDIAAGLCLSVVRNYLYKVVGTKPVGDHIVLQGGVAYNPGIVAAFRYFYGDRLTVSPWFPISGAVGVAFIAKEELEKEQTVSARNINEEELEKNKKFYSDTKKLLLENYTFDGTLEPKKKKIGIPRSLTLYKLFPMANAFFTELGFQVILSHESSEETIRSSQQTCQSECCYPVKLVHGHMAQLANMGVDYIFMPAMHTIRHECSTVEHNYACSFMQTAPMMAAKALHLKERGIELLSPVLDMEWGEEILATAMLELGKQLGKSERESALALLSGGFAVNEFTRKEEEMGEELLENLRTGEKVLVMITRQYNIEDPVLNMDIPSELLKRGYKVINLSHLHAHDIDISNEYPDLYWPFGQHVLSGARIIRNTPGLYAIYLTNHGCGPDTMLSHLFREEMQGKPYLQIEVDEHYSKVGVITRIEAFLNSLEASSNAGFTQESIDRLKSGKWDTGKKVKADFILEKGLTTGVPRYGIFSELIANWLTSKGYPSQVMQPNRLALEEGRKETTSKEYYTFSMLLGIALQSTQQQLIIPSNEGADADGQYWRVIRTIMDEQNKKDVAICPVVFDTMLKKYPTEVMNAFFLQILAGDLYYMAPPEIRAELLKENQKIESMEMLLSLAEKY